MGVIKFEKGDWMEAKITYFEKGGEDNTDVTFGIAKKRAEELGIKTILIASTRGIAAAKAATFFKGYKIVAVGHITGYREPNKNEFTDENKAIVEKAGGAVVFAADPMTGITRRATPPPTPGVPPVMPTGSILEIPEIVAGVLRMFCAGIKVVIEIAGPAADAGLIRTDEDIIAIAGSNRGADTAVVMRAAKTRDMLRMRIKEILCKPLAPAGPPAGGMPGAGAGAGAPGAHRPA